jgi:hypothetical protein
MLRRLLNIASVVCLVLCVVLTALYVRSYYRYGELRGRLTENDVFVIGVPSGRMRLTMLEPKFTQPGIPMRYHWPWAIANKPAIVFDKSPVGHGYLAWLGFDLDSNAQFSTVIIPLWFVAIMLGASAALFQLHWPWRFTLRSLFIATTFLAVVLGMIAWLDRAWIGK